MKIFVSVLLLICAAAAGLPAGDADVLAPGESRVTLTGNFFNTTGSYNQDGKAVPDLSWRGLSAGGSFEYGIAPVLTIGLAWLPGYSAWSEFRSGPPTGDPTFNDPSDPVVGFKIPVIGPRGMFQLAELRVAAEPFIIVALPETDWAVESERMNAGKPYLVSKRERHVPALGAKVHADWRFLERLFLYANLSYTFFFADDQDPDYIGPQSLPVPTWFGADTNHRLEAGWDLLQDGDMLMTPGLAYELKYTASTRINGVNELEKGYMQFFFIPYLDFTFPFKEPKLDLGMRLEAAVPVAGFSNFQTWIATASFSVRLK